MLLYASHHAYQLKQTLTLSSWDPKKKKKTAHLFFLAWLWLLNKVIHETGKSSLAHEQIIYWSDQRCDSFILLLLPRMNF